MKERPSSWWIDNLLRPAVIAAMLTCLAAPPITFLEWIAGDWDGTYVLVFAFVAGLEGILSERTLQKQKITGWSYLVSRTAEFLVLMLILKLTGYASLGFEQLRADALKWSIDISTFVNQRDLLLALLFLFLWGGAIYVARMAKDLDMAQRPSPPRDKTSIEYYMWLTQPPLPYNREEVLKRLGEFFVWGGVLLLLMATVVFFLVSADKGHAWPVLFYFVLGIALMSQGQFSMLASAWQAQSITVQPGITRRWLAWVVTFVCLVALVALLLPTWYTMGPLQALLGVFAILVNLATLLVALVAFLLTLPFALFGSNEQLPPPTFVPQPPVLPEAMPTGTSNLEIVISAIFWTALLAILTYSVYRFYRDRVGNLSEETLGTNWWGRILLWFKQLWARWRSWQQGVGVRLVQRRAKDESGREVRPRPFRFFFAGRLPPRELIRYFYLSAERRADEAGRPRLPGQTPYEYQVSLDESFPDLEPDLTGLTEAFVRARYSPQQVERADAEAIKPLWRRIKAALRRRRFAEKE